MNFLCKVVGQKWYESPSGKDGCICVRCKEKNWAGNHAPYKRSGSCLCMFALDVTIVCGRSMNGMAVRVLGAARCGIANINGSELTVR